MDIWSALKVIVRHWMVVGLGLCLTVVAVLAVGNSVKPEYVANGSVILHGPSVTSGYNNTPVEINPLGTFGAGERVAGQAVLTVMRSRPFKSDAQRKGADGTWELFFQQEGAIIELSVTSETERAALRTLDILVEMLKEELGRQQREVGAPQATWITADILTSTRSASQQTGDRTKAMVAAALVGVGLTFTLAFAVEAVSSGAMARVWRRFETDEAGGEGGAPPSRPGHGGDLQPLPPRPVVATAGPAVPWTPPADAPPFRLGDGEGHDDDRMATPAHAEGAPFKLSNGAPTRGSGNGGTHSQPSSAPPFDAER